MERFLGKFQETSSMLRWGFVMRWFFATVLASCALGGASCGRPPPHVVLTIEDPYATSTDFAKLSAGISRDQLKAVDFNSVRLQFPLVITIETASRGEISLWVETYDSAGKVLGRGTGTARFLRTHSPSATIQLALACVSHGQCSDHVYCNGAEMCTNGMCAPSLPPCASNFACVHTACMEFQNGDGACSVSVEHSLCEADSYCDPGAGCVLGQPCSTDEQCQDSFVCNGEEQCVNFHCLGGSPPSINDEDICTLDGCNDARAESNLDPIFHAALASLNGSACIIPGTEDLGQSGVCVSAKLGCSFSECGDGVVFIDDGESCDDGPANANEWSLGKHCNADCSNWAPYCGDQMIADTFETCDAGAGNGSGTGCTLNCELDGECGDGITQSLFEECDDHNPDECDGCRTTCQYGCNCFSPNPCEGANWCEQGLCVACDVPGHCGPVCAECSETTPTCAGPEIGCVCDAEPGPRGTCLYGTYCDNGACNPCDVPAHCGQDCRDCTLLLDTPLCGGTEVGCVVDPTLDPPSLGCAGKPDFTLCQVVTAFDTSYDVCMDGQCISPGCLTGLCHPHGPSFAQADVDPNWEYPDTNQRVCYDATEQLECPALPCQDDGGPLFCGQDAQYGWDTSNPDPSVRWNRSSGDEPIVLDYVTNLEWQGCHAGRHGQDCTQGGNVVFDQWEAVWQCDQLVWAGYADWRLPDYYELASILDLGKIAPKIDTDTFPGVPSGWSPFWTSTVDSSSQFLSWVVSFQDGIIDRQSRVAAYTTFTRCVRGGPEQIGSAPRFSRTEPDPINALGEYVVEDFKTDLTWQGCIFGRIESSCDTGSNAVVYWQDALDLCEGLDWAGFTDWRVPSRHELMTIVDISKNSPALDQDMFPGPGSLNFWSSTSTISSAWFIDFTSGFSFGTSRTLGGASLRCVRDND